jgi:hypothetical protein
MGKQRLTRDGGGHQRRGGRQQQHAPTAIRQPDEQPEREEDAEKPHLHPVTSDTFQQNVEIERRAAPDILRVAVQKGLR